MLIVDNKSPDKEDLNMDVDVSSSVDQPPAHEAGSSSTPYPPEKDEPPPYVPSSPSVPSSSASQLEGSSSQPLPKSNFLEISRQNSSVKGSWRIDTKLFVPPSVLPPLEPGSVRPHLKLFSHNGSVNGEVELVNAFPETEEKRERAILIAESKNGRVTLKLTNQTPQRTNIHCTSLNGSVQVYVPRSFHGPIKAGTVHGSVTFSTEISKTLTYFSERNGVRNCFLGPYNESVDYGKDTSEPWSEDELVAETKNGSVQIYYIDEAIQPDIYGSTRKGFWSKLFS